MTRNEIEQLAAVMLAVIVECDNHRDNQGMRMTNGAEMAGTRIAEWIAANHPSFDIDAWLIATTIKASGIA